VIPGLRAKAIQLNAELGGLTRKEIIAMVIVFACILVMSLRSFIPALEPVDKTAIILTSTILFFITGILDINDLEDIPWNIILLFSGRHEHRLLPLGDRGRQVAGGQLAGDVPEGQLVRFRDEHRLLRDDDDQLHHERRGHRHLAAGGVRDRALPGGRPGGDPLRRPGTTAGMPFLLLVGAAPNAIAYDSKQFTTGEFFLYGLPTSLILMVVVGFAVFILWPLMGMPTTLP
jgi:solute carrier family 13 (sodium-dependent dicarboxylate transporter), member 2/3/5